MFMPDYSPWGDIQHADELYTGVHFVSTASHGGVMMLRQIVENLLDKQVQDYGFWFGNYLCFEEDCDAPIAIRELMDKGLYTAPTNEFYKPGEYEDCINRSLQCWHPDYWLYRNQKIGA
ncbi:MAG: hypothetical protein J6B76_08025 [Peptococcaceae bacterium]|nr:hypothetical protein [Peptococcaceae bacterium]